MIKKLIVIFLFLTTCVYGFYLNYKPDLNIEYISLLNNYEGNYKSKPIDYIYDNDNGECIGYFEGDSYYYDDNDLEKTVFVVINGQEKNTMNVERIIERTVKKNTDFVEIEINEFLIYYSFYDDNKYIGFFEKDNGIYCIEFTSSTLTGEEFKLFVNDFINKALV